MNITRLLISIIFVAALCLPVLAEGVKEESAAADSEKADAEKAEKEKAEKAAAEKEKAEKHRKSLKKKAMMGANRQGGVIVQGGQLRVRVDATGPIEGPVRFRAKSKDESARGKTSFDLPQELPNGAVPKFHNAGEEATVEYSGGTVLKVYIYTDEEELNSDFEMFAVKMEKVTAEESKKLEAQGAVIEKSEKAPAVYFKFQEAIIAFVFRAGADRADMIAAGEAFLRTEEERRAEIFATPELTFDAAKSAATDYDFAAFRIAFLEEVSASAKEHLERLRTEYRNMLSRKGSYYSRYDSDVVAEIESSSDNEAVIVIKGSDGKPRSQSMFSNIPWVRAICGRRAYTGIEIIGYRCHMVMREGRWFIDLDANLSADAEILHGSQEDRMSEAEKKVVRILRILAESQTGFYAGDFDGDRKRDYAQNIAELVDCLGEKGAKMKTLLEDNPSYRLKISAKDGDPHWYGTAEPVKTSFSGMRTTRAGAYSKYMNAKFFYIDETGIVRFETGKPANAKSAEYRE